MKATFAAGCFWHVEELFSKVKGVTSTSVGYTGGHLENPSYEAVCTDETGHAEAIQIEYDPSLVSYEELLNMFWKCHDPTTLNRQGPDIGTQYRSTIFFHDSEQEKTALESKEELQNSNQFGREIVTQIVPAKTFFRAEEYHQRYFEKNNVTCFRPGF